MNEWLSNGMNEWLMNEWMCNGIRIELMSNRKKEWIMEWKDE